MVITLTRIYWCKCSLKPWVLAIHTPWYLHTIPGCKNIHQGKDLPHNGGESKIPLRKTYHETSNTRSSHWCPHQQGSKSHFHKITHTHMDLKGYKEHSLGLYGMDKKNWSTSSKIWVTSSSNCTTSSLLVGTWEPNNI